MLLNNFFVLEVKNKNKVSLFSNTIEHYFSYALAAGYRLRHSCMTIFLMWYQVKGEQSCIVLVEVLIVGWWLGKEWLPKPTLRLLLQLLVFVRDSTQLSWYYSLARHLTDIYCWTKILPRLVEDVLFQFSKPYSKCDSSETHNFSENLWQHLLVSAICNFSRCTQQEYRMFNILEIIQ